jgi:hypothetical protein
MTKIYPLIEQLEKLTVKPDRAALAKLRRGLGKSLGSAEMYPLISIRPGINLRLKTEQL